jgi:predicted transcriptional regulator of viral defense system
MPNPRRASNFRELQSLASSQGGYFTAKQAARLGYGYSHLCYHLGASNIERAGHGLYRMLVFPISEHDDLVRLSLWSRDRDEVPQAVVSHATALVLNELAGLLPDTIDLSVPPRFQKRPPSGCRLHRTRLQRKDIELREGFRVTTPLRTLLDVASLQESAAETLASAVASAIERGLVRRSSLERRARSSAGAERIRQALRANAETGA